MEQWESCKKQAKGALLLFRMGDFYEAFYEDANIFAKTLDITLTQRQGIPMAGVPCQSCETCVEKLVGQGFRVAIAEQVEDAKFAKGLVRREVTRIITPGTTIFSTGKFEKQNNFIGALSQVGQIYALCLCDHSTGEFRVFETDNQKDLVTELFHKQVTRNSNAISRISQPKNS